MAYKIIIRKNGKHHGEMGPYSSQQAAQSDANTIKIRLAGDADVVVRRVEVGGMKFVPAHGSSHSPGHGHSPGHSAPKLPPSMPPMTVKYGPMPPKPPKGDRPHGVGKLPLFGASQPWLGEGEPWEASIKSYKPYVPPPPRIAAGGVVINDDGLILVREPLNHFDGYVWSLPKGGVDAGETDEQGALREVEEETGVRAEIVERIPGEWKGGTSINRYFLMRPVENTGQHDDETEQIAFVTYDEAKEMLGMSTNQRGRERDLEVLDAGYALWLKRKHGAKSNPHRFA